MSIDTPNGTEPGTPATAYLERLRVALERLGENAIIRESGSGPRLEAVGRGPRLTETINVREEGGEVRGHWSWGEPLPDDIAAAARAIRRVVNPAVAE